MNVRQEIPEVLDLALGGGFIREGVLSLIKDLRPELSREVVRRPSWDRLNPVARALSREIWMLQPLPSSRRRVQIPTYYPPQGGAGYKSLPPQGYRKGPVVPGAPAPPPAPHTGYLGIISPWTYSDEGMGAAVNNTLRVCKYSMIEQGTATLITIGFTNVSGSYQCQTRGEIYSDASDYPATKTAESEQKNVQAGGYIDFAFSDTVLAVGVWWIGPLIGASAATIGKNGYITGTTNQEWVADGAYGAYSPVGPTTFPSNMVHHDRSMLYMVTYHT